MVRRHQRHSVLRTVHTWAQDIIHAGVEAQKLVAAYACINLINHLEQERASVGPHPARCQARSRAGVRGLWCGQNLPVAEVELTHHCRNVRFVLCPGTRATLKPPPISRLAASGIAAAICRAVCMAPAQAAGSAPEPMNMEPCDTSTGLAGGSERLGEVLVPQAKAGTHATRGCAFIMAGAHPWVDAETKLPWLVRRLQKQLQLMCRSRNILHTRRKQSRQIVGWLLA